ncbi:glycoside hydrolase family 16 protein [Brachyspira hampsonii]|uniref:GH16 domain-containing protein n=1 Tax=Brachyspira hampsonii TaxID=1287055 RepID=A0AAC9TVW2_9SPIR|nr:glycoside hydrolase family 16 protein [Brachyspira hampsonii]ASJ21396.1 hypothetical protein BHAMNSH16_06955 [Brachyspira hampsonii]ELV05602.1 glucan endo-1,3-beta-glucosidase A1 domain protein [Brachyspira hampsonii 30599]
MKKIILFLSVLILSIVVVVSCNNKGVTGSNTGITGQNIGNGPAKTDIPTGENIAFKEDFNEGTIPDDFCGLCVTEESPSTWNRYFQNTDGYEMVRIEDGNLVLKAIYDGSKGGDDFRTGGVYSHNNRYGVGTRLSVRAKLKNPNPSGNNDFNVRGAFPAIWYYPLFTKNPWPDDGEIDLMEWIIDNPQKAWLTVQYSKASGGSTSKTANSPGVNTGIDMNAYHVYTCDIVKDKVILYIDGKKALEFTPSDPAGQKRYPYNDMTYYIILNASYQNGSWCPAPNKDSSANYEMWVDWVKVEKIDPDDSSPALPSTTF